MPSMVLTAPVDQPILADVLPNCLRAMRLSTRDMRGIASPQLELSFPAVRGVVVILVDGLGAEQLRARAGHARTITRGWEHAHLAHSFPSTTVAGITSLTTARRAGAHGMVSYTVWHREAREYLNQISGWGERMHPATWQLAPTVFEQLTATGGAQPIVVADAAYSASGLTRASLRGGEYRTAQTMLARSEVAAAAARELEHPLIYLYHAELDQIGHNYGWESERWTAALEELDAAVARLLALLPADIGVLLLADHGMIDIAYSQQREIEEGVLTNVVAVAGEPRLRHLYLDAAASTRQHTELVRRLQDSVGEEAIVYRREEVIELGWYGQVAPQARERIGDVLLAATAPVSYFTVGMPAGTRTMIGQHGSITPAETTVPLVRLGAFA